MEDTSFNDSGFFNDSSLIDGDVSNALHPSKYELEHIDKLQLFSEDLQQAIRSSYPRPVHPYTAVNVLLLRWTDDDLNVQVELDRLRNTFERQFSFTTEQWNIPSQNSTRALQSKLYDFQNDHQVETELLIVYYGGHGEASRRGKSVWAANNRPDSSTLTWSSLQHLLENAVPHVLIILDCCFAANAARNTAEGTTKELLAACGRENPTTGVSERSFTSALVEELQAFGSNPFTVAMLHSRLVTIRWRLKYTPIYALLSEHGGNSIQLSPLPKAPVQKPCIQVENDDDGMPIDDPMDLSSNEESMFSSSPHQSSQSSEPPRLETRVLLAVSIQQDAARDISQWVNWLTTKPPWEVTKIEVKVEGTYESHSTLMLVSLPIFAWDNLPQREAYRFIAFIRSGNLQQPRASSPLATKTLVTESRSSGDLESIDTSGSKQNPEERSVVVKATSSRPNARSTETIIPPLSAGEMASKPHRSSLERMADPTEDKMSPLLRQSLTHGKRPYLSRKTKAKVPENSSDATSTSPKGLPSISESAQASETKVTTLSAPSELSKPSVTGDKLPLVSRKAEYEATSTEKPVVKGPKAPKASTSKRVHRAEPYPSSSAAITTTAPWGLQDDEQLRQARQKGMNWAPIAQKYFPTRTANACRKRHEKLIEKSQEWSQSKLDEMARCYRDVQEQMWSMMSSRLGEHWKTVEAKCMEKGIKTLKSSGRRRERASNEDNFADSGLGPDSYDHYSKGGKGFYDSGDENFDDSALGPEPTNSLPRSTYSNLSNYAAWTVPPTAQDAQRLYQEGQWSHVRPMSHQPYQFPSTMIQQQMQQNQLPNIGNALQTTGSGGISSALAVESRSDWHTVEAK